MGQNEPVTTWRAWTFEPRERRLSRADVGVVSLPKKTLSLLALLLEQAPHLVTKDQILSTVWQGTSVEEGNIAFHVKILRRTLDAPDEASCIETVRGFGYRFVAPLSIREPAPEPVSAPRANEATVTAATPARRGFSPRLTQYAVSAAQVLLLGLSGAVVWFHLPPADASVRSVTVLSGTPGLDDLIASNLAREAPIDATVGIAGIEGESAAQAGVRLGAETVLTTTIDQLSDAWQVSVQLTRAQDARRLWAWVFTIPADTANRGS